MKTFSAYAMVLGLIFCSSAYASDADVSAPIGTVFAFNQDLVFVADQYSRSIFFENGKMTQRMTWWKLPKERPSTDSIVCDLGIGFYDQLLPVRVKKNSFKLDHYGEYDFDDQDPRILVLSGLERPITVRCGHLHATEPRIETLVTPTIETLQQAFGGYISVTAPSGL